jgi:hypothetical protein
VWLALGPDALPPSLKLHAHDVIVPVEVSENVTVSGAAPRSGLLVKDATGTGGGGSLTTIWWLTESVPPGPLTVNDAV